MLTKDRHEWDDFVIREVVEPGEGFADIIQRINPELHTYMGAAILKDMGYNVPVDCFPEIKFSGSRWWLLYQGSNAIGYAFAAKATHRTQRVGGIFVADEHRGQRLASHLWKVVNARYPAAYWQSGAWYVRRSVEKHWGPNHHHKDVLVDPYVKGFNFATLIGLVGNDRIDPGQWMRPVRVTIEDNKERETFLDICEEAGWSAWVNP